VDSGHSNFEAADRETGRRLTVGSTTRLAMAGAATRGYHASMDPELKAQFDDLHAALAGHMEATNARFDRLEAALASHVEATNAGFDRLESALASHIETRNARFERLETRLADHDARFDRLEAALAKQEARFDRFMELMASHFEAMQGRIDERMDRLEQRMDRLEESMDRLEGRLDAMDRKFTEMFIGVNERFASARLRAKQFEARVSGLLETMGSDLARLTDRMTALEANTLALNERVDGLADDMRLRFRQVDERLSERLEGRTRAIDAPVPTEPCRAPMASVARSG
jgi:chromosome segregation ATPase